MASKVFTGVTDGVDARLIEVEAEISNSLPAFVVVGLADSSIKEAKERIRSAIRSSKIEYPLQKKVVNLAPAEIKKSGTHFDLPIAISILVCSGVVTEKAVARTVFAGELSLDGSVRDIAGAVNIALMAKKYGFKRVILPRSNAKQVSFIDGVEVFGVNTLAETIGFLNGRLDINCEVFAEQDDLIAEEDIYSKIQGNLIGKRALEIAAAGGHHLLFYGLPGTGKTMLANSLVDLMPKLEMEEKIDVMKIYSLFHKSEMDDIRTTQRPFRSVHQSASDVAILGGGNPIKPGEITLAHNGILFLDEIPEFRKSLIESLRQVLVEKKINISRSSSKIQYPADFILVAAMNPCPCGMYDLEENLCICRPGEIFKYQKKISGPILERIDLWCHVKKDSSETKFMAGESLTEVKMRIRDAKLMQKKRYSGTDIKNNAALSGKNYLNFIRLESNADAVFGKIANVKMYSYRSKIQLLKIARTIADIARSNLVLEEHLYEAMQFRDFALNINN